MIRNDDTFDLKYIYIKYVHVRSVTCPGLSAANVHKMLIFIINVSDLHKQKSACFTIELK